MIDLKKARERLGLSQSQLAGALGVHIQTVSAWETGRQEAPLYIELALCELERRRKEQKPKRRPSSKKA